MNHAQYSAGWKYSSIHKRAIKILEWTSNLIRHFMMDAIT